MSKPIHIQGDLVDAEIYGYGNRVCIVLDVQDNGIFEHQVKLQERGSHRVWILPESYVSSPLNRDLCD